jgi:hypothetical protein
MIGKYGKSMAEKNFNRKKREQEEKKKRKCCGQIVESIKNR